MSADVRFRVTTPLGVSDVRVGHRTETTSPWAEALRTLPDTRRVGLIVDRNVADHWDDPDMDGRDVVARVVAPAGEAAKTREVLASLQDAMMSLRRNDLLVAVGGGAVLDVAGFAAATVRRGVPWAAVATSVVAMADAAIGGKVAVNHQGGKNLLGTFHPPRLVVSDVAYLESLPAREAIAGLAEIYKCSEVAVGVPLPDLDAAKLRSDLLATGARTPAQYAHLVAACARLKGAIVTRDERDFGERRLLNFGHTIGHALERVVGPEALRHGEAVSIGMVAAWRLAAGRGTVPGDAPDVHAENLRALGLPVAIPASTPSEQILRAMAQDKKRTASDQHTFVLPTAGGLVIVDDVSDDEMQAVLD